MSEQPELTDPTPPPWVADHDCDPPDISSEGPWREGGNIICEAPAEYEASMRYWPANSRMIVACWDLLLALEGMIEAVHSGDPGGSRLRAARAAAGKARGGFTLIELLVVITIIVVISVIALPTVLPALSRRQVSEAGRLIQAAIAGARDEAIRNNAPSGIRLLPDPNFDGIGPPTITTYDSSGNPTVAPNPYAGVLDPNQVLACNRIVPLSPAPSYSEGRVNVFPSTAYPPSITGGIPALVLEQAPWDSLGAPNPPTAWFWNIRVGDRVQPNNSGPWYTVVGPVKSVNSDMFVNVGPPGSPSPFGSGCDYLLLVNGRDDDGDGSADEGFDGLDNDWRNGIDDAAEWEAERWAIPGNSRIFSAPYAIARRPVPGPASRVVDLPSNVVIDLTTWATTRERSRCTVNPYSGSVDIMVNPDGTLAMTTIYSTPASFGMSAAFVHLWLADRSSLALPQGAAAPLLPIGDITGDYAEFNPPVDPKPYWGPRIGGDFAVITLFAGSGRLAIADNPAFDNPADPISSYYGNPIAYDSGLPFIRLQQGIR